ncbi:MAG: hypothetical protein LW815_00490 [Chitinophagaceae bacterium]|nr:hypothetical protein [Chitinophagaceae bacterium]
MTKETDFMIQSLFQRESMDEMTLDELKCHAEEFPYSSIIQFLYTCKLKSQYHLDFPEAVSKTALFFDESSWLNYQLSEEAEKGNFRKILYDKQFNNVSEDEMIESLNSSAEVRDVDEIEVNIDDKEAHFDEPSIVEPIAANDVQNLEPAPSPQPGIELEIPITPYHTIDYFASLGIKINIEGEKDDLSMKVKSFTAWLKTMKRLQPGAETVTIKDIQSILDTNNEKENPADAVFTEAMAEVYLKQGLTEKAIEVYDKLSLQNPLNSHIFADKISKIKENKV